MDLRKICQDRTYVFAIEEDQFDGADEVIKKIFNHAGLDEPTDFSFITSNYNYDAYKVEAAGRQWFVKFSLDTSLDSFLIEAINGKVKFGDDISYAVIPFIRGENLKNLGVASILENQTRIATEYFAQMAQRKVTQSFPSWIVDTFKATNLLELSGEAIEAIKDHSEWETILEIANAVELELTAFSIELESKFKKRKPCHGNFKPSNIILSEDLILVDYDHSFYGNQFLDLASIIIWSGISGKEEKDFFTAWLVASGQELSQNVWVEYKTCYEFMLRKIFLEILSSYLKEVYMLASTRPMKILSLVDLFARNSKEFLRMSSVSKHYDFITKAMLEPIIGAEIKDDQT